MYLASKISTWLVFLPFRKFIVKTCTDEKSDTSEWSAKLAERDLVLNRLEEAEAAYISSFRLVPTSSGRRIEAQAETRYDFVAPKGVLTNVGL